MIGYEKIKTKARVFQQMTGLPLKAFRKLLPTFKKAYEQEQETEEEIRVKPRQRKKGGGRKGKLGSEADKLVFILFYFKFYPIQEVQGFFFGISQSQVNYWVHYLTPILNEALGYEKQLPARKTRQIKQVLAECPDLEFIIDGTQRPIQRPKNKKRQRDCYSGKKRRHTIKNNVISQKGKKKIRGLSPTVPGKMHDKKLADEQELEFPPDTHLWQDTGFQGYHPPNVTIHQPFKKPKGGQLSPAQKEHNKLVSKERVEVEHSIGGVKIFRIVRDIYRNHRQDFDDLIMETACGLFNLRLDFSTVS